MAKHLTPPGWKPPFVVPAHLTKDIPTRHDPIQSDRWKKPRHFGPAPKYTKEEARRRHIKLLLRQRHAHKIDESIARLEERLTILKEIRDEDRGEGNGGGNSSDTKD